MKIAGFLKTTLLDYPGRISASVYLAGCNLRCPFCQNSGLICPQDTRACRPEEILAFLKKRRGILEGVCISGGEPTLQPDLPAFIRRIKDLGYPVKLDTNGTNPHMLALLIREGLIDYAAMDIKGTPEQYPALCGMDPASFLTDPILRSVSLLKEQTKIPFEFRTTLIREFHTEKDLLRICQWIAPAPLYALQMFRRADTVPDQDLHPWPPDQMKHIRDICLAYIPNTILRGMD